MSQANVSMASIAATESPSLKRKIGEVEGASSVNPSPKFVKSSNNKVVPTVVAVDMGIPQKNPVQQTVVQTAVQQTAPVGSVSANSGSSTERFLPDKLNWKLINNRAALERILRINKMSFKGQKGGAAFIAVDVNAYREITGEQVQLDEYNHFKVRGPFMLNIWGISSQINSGNVSYSVNFDINDCSRDPQVQEFAQFLALVDDVLLEKCMHLSINTKEIREEVQWVDFCKDDSGEINLKKLRSVVAKNFSGALRAAKTAKAKPDFAPVTVDPQTDKAMISDAFFFKAKIRSKKNNQNLMDLTCCTMENEPVFYGAVKELFSERSTYVQADFDVTSINYTGKTFYSSWIARKVKYQIKPNAGENGAVETDFEGNVISKEMQDKIELQAQEFLKKNANLPVPEGMIVEGDGEY